MGFNEMESWLVHWLKNEYRYRKFLDSNNRKFNETEYYKICQKEADDKIKKILKDYKDIRENLKKLTYQINDFLVFTYANQKNIYYNLWLDLNKYLENYKMEMKTDRIYYYLRSMDLIDDKYEDYLLNKFG